MAARALSRLWKLASLLLRRVLRNRLGPAREVARFSALALDDVLLALVGWNLLVVEALSLTSLTLVQSLAADMDPVSILEEVLVLAAVRPHARVGDRPAGC